MSGRTKTMSMLTILLATSKTTRDTLQAADNPVDAELLALLERMIERAEDELLQLSELDEPS